MEKRAFLLIGMTALTLTASAAKQSPTAPIQEVSFTQVHLNDGFWSLQAAMASKVIAIKISFFMSFVLFWRQSYKILAVIF